MRSHLIALAVAGLFGALAASDASACHFKPKCGKPACAPACPPPAPVCAPPAPKECCFKMPKIHCQLPKFNCQLPKFNCHLPKISLCHKQTACAPAPCGEAPCATAPVVYESAPVYAAPQGVPSGQAVYSSGQ